MRRTSVLALFIVGLLLPSVLSSSSVGIHEASAQTTPEGIVHFVPITLTNSQTSATPAPFQLMITVDSATYSSYEAPELQNVEFFDSTGALIPSWLQSGASSGSTDTVYWLKISGGISASSSVTVYLGFAPPTTNLFNAQTTGEAPASASRTANTTMVATYSHTSGTSQGPAFPADGPSRRPPVKEETG